MPRRRASPPGNSRLSWVLNSSFVSAVIAGPRTEEQWDDYLRALDYRFTAEDEALIRPAGDQRPSLDTGLQRSRLSDRRAKGPRTAG